MILALGYFGGWKFIPLDSLPSPGALPAGDGDVPQPQALHGPEQGQHDLRDPAGGPVGVVVLDRRGTLHIREQVRLVLPTDRTFRHFRGRPDKSLPSSRIAGHGQVVEGDVGVGASVVDVQAARVDRDGRHPPMETVHGMALATPGQHVAKDGLLHVPHDQDPPQRPVPGVLGLDQPADDLHIFLPQVLGLGVGNGEKEEIGRKGGLCQPQRNP